MAIEINELIIRTSVDIHSNTRQRNDNLVSPEQLTSFKNEVIRECMEAVQDLIEKNNIHER